jgi:hypothetical protein
VPNRILREGILTSERVDKLAAQAEVFYRRLMSVVDDFGRFDGRIAMLRASLYPLRIDVVREADISHWLAEVQSAGLIALYAVDGKPYIQLQDFRQQVRATHSKYPPPPENAKHLRSSCAAGAKRVRTKTYAQTETETIAAQARPAAEKPTNGQGEGEPPPSSPPRKARKTPTGPAAELERHFVSKWMERYGEPYAWRRGKDDAHNAWIREHTSSLEQAKLVVDRYLTGDDRFACGARHTLGVLVSQFERYKIPDEADETFARADVSDDEILSVLKGGDAA